MYRKKESSLVILIMLVLTSFAVTMPTTMADGFRTVRGDVYIDEILAGDGLDVRLSFPSGNEYDLDGTSSTGYYEITFPDNLHILEWGNFFVTHNSVEYQAEDDQGNPAKVKIMPGEDRYFEDLYIDTGSPANQPPVADAGGPYNGFLNVPITLDGSGSYDPDGTIVAWLWDLGDGNTSTYQNPTHTYTQTGNFPLSLTVTDDDGATNTDSSSSVTIDEDNEPPSKVTGLTVTDAKDGKLNLAWTAATDNAGIDYYNIYRDGPLLTTVTSTSYQNTGLTNGQSYEYEISAVDVSGIEGEKSDPESGTPTETPPYVPPVDPPVDPPYNPPDNHNPVANASAGEPYQGIPGEEITFDGSSSSDPEGTELQYRWDFDGDGTYDTNWSTEATATHSYEQAGDYTVILQVKDVPGATDTDETTATITTPNIPPENLALDGPTTGNKITEYSYIASATDLDDDSMQYTIDWGDDNTDSSLFLENGTSYSIDHSWDAAGKYTVELSVYDNETTSVIQTKPYNIH